MDARLFQSLNPQHIQFSHCHFILVSAGIKLFFSIEYGTVLCCGFRRKMVLTAQWRFFQLSLSSAAQSQGRSAFSYRLQRGAEGAQGAGRRQKRDIRPKWPQGGSMPYGVLWKSCNTEGSWLWGRPLCGDWLGIGQCIVRNCQPKYLLYHYH